MNEFLTLKELSTQYRISLFKKSIFHNSILAFKNQKRTMKVGAEKIGANSHLLVEKNLAQDRFPLKNLRKVQGILGLKNQISREEMEYASEMAIEFNRMNYDRIKRFAKTFVVLIFFNYKNWPSGIDGQEKY